MWLCRELPVEADAEELNGVFRLDPFPVDHNRHVVFTLALAMSATSLAGLATSVAGSATSVAGMATSAAGSGTWLAKPV
jgi:hypothetical protein